MVGTLRSFVSDAAHELHTPLTALQTNLELARDEGKASDHTRYLERAQEQGLRLEALATGLLDLSRIEVTDHQSSFASVNLSRLLPEIAEPYASRAEQSDRIFELDLPVGEIEVMGNEMQLRQVVENLLENAIKFTHAGDTIRLSAVTQENEVIIEITDTGMGIPMDELSNIFKRFHRGRNVSNIAGNGLGLAIVKAVVEKHRGQVVVESMGPDRGSTFKVILPASPSEK
jgi:signal transduction histidine kinase